MGEGSEREAGGHALSKLGVISGPREHDLERGLSALRSEAVGEGSEREQEEGWRALCEEARNDLGAERARLGGGT